MNVSFNITCDNHNHNHNHKTKSDSNNGLPCEEQFESQVPEGDRSCKVLDTSVSLDGEGLENVRYRKAPVVSLAQGEVKPLMRQGYWPWDSRYLIGGGKLCVEGRSFVLHQNPCPPNPVQ